MPAYADDTDANNFHPNSAGFGKLARCRWNKTLAELMGYNFQANELVPACNAVNIVTAFADLSLSLLV